MGLVSVRNLAVFIGLLSGGTAAMPIACHAEEPQAAAFMQHVSSLDRIILGGGINSATFFSAKPSCISSCSVSGGVILYNGEWDDGYGTFVPFVWTPTKNPSKRGMSFVEIDYDAHRNQANFELPGADEANRQGIQKIVLFYQAKLNSTPVTLIFIGELVGPVQNSVANSSYGGTYRAKLTVLEFTQSMLAEHVKYSFQPVFSFTTTSTYGNADIALWNALGLPGIKQ